MPLSAKTEIDEMNTRYEATSMQKDVIISRLRDRGCRITRQRKMLLDIILNEGTGSCKEIYYKASRKDPRIGVATVYRMVNVLEEIGAVSRKNIYRVNYQHVEPSQASYEVELDDNTLNILTEDELFTALGKGLRRKGLINDQKIVSVKKIRIP